MDLIINYICVFECKKKDLEQYIKNPQPNLRNDTIPIYHKTTKQKGGKANIENKWEDENFDVLITWFKYVQTCFCTIYSLTLKT